MAKKKDKPASPMKEGYEFREWEGWTPPPEVEYFYIIGYGIHAGLYYPYQAALYTHMGERFAKAQILGWYEKVIQS